MQNPTQLNQFYTSPYDHSNISKCKKDLFIIKENLSLKQNSKLLKKPHNRTKHKSKKITSDKKDEDYYLSDLQKHYEENLKCQYSESTFAIYNRLFNNLIDFLGDHPLNTYHLLDFERYKNERIKTTKETSVNIEIRHSKALFNEAIRMNMLEENPVSRIKQFRINEELRLSFSNEQIKLIIVECSNNKLKGIILFAYYTGCRLNEILNIQHEDINLSENKITIKNKDDFRTKTGRIRRIPINIELEGYLKKSFEDLMESARENDVNKILKSDQYLFNNNGKKFRKDTISKSFKKIIRKLKLDERFNFHCLRHSFATNLIKAGVNIYEVKTLLGHTSIQTTIKYLHTDNEALRNAVNRLTAVGGEYGKS